MYICKRVSVQKLGTFDSFEEGHLYSIYDRSITPSFRSSTSSFIYQSGPSSPEAGKQSPARIDFERVYF